ncbi:MAG: ATP synthase subunit I [Sulfuriferula sp.]
MVLQMLVSMAVAAIFWMTGSFSQAESALYGGLASVALAVLLKRNLIKAGQFTLDTPRKGLFILYLGAMQRFIIVLGIFGVGFAVFKFKPLASLIGFGAAQLSYLARLMRNRWKEPAGE